MFPLKTLPWGFPWWSSGYDSAVPTQGAWVRFLVGELDPTCSNYRFHMLQRRLGTAKKKKTKTFPESHQGVESFEHELSILLPFVVQSLSRVQLFVTPWTIACRLPCPTLSKSLLKLMSIESAMPSNHFILCHPLLLPSVFSSIRVFSNELAVRIRWPKYCRFNVSSSNEYSGFISFRLTGLISLLLLQHHNSKASIPWSSAFFMVQLSQESYNKPRQHIIES